MFGWGESARKVTESLWVIVVLDRARAMSGTDNSPVILMNLQIRTEVVIPSMLILLGSNST